jgi:hypothetical protein
VHVISKRFCASLLYSVSESRRAVEWIRQDTRQSCLFRQRKIASAIVEIRATNCRLLRSKSGLERGGVCRLLQQSWRLSSYNYVLTVVKGVLWLASNVR